MGGSDTEGPDHDTLAANDEEARWWTTEPPTMTADVRIDADWWQAVERAHPSGPAQANCREPSGLHAERAVG